jgi:hypothetical protein
VSNSVQYSVKLTGSQNAREHWRTRAKRVKAERAKAENWCFHFLEKPTTWPVVVRLTRIGPRKLDSDNVSGACKAVRDGVADFLGINDGDESKVSWVYAQELGQYGVRIELLWRYRAPVVEAETDGADPADVETWDEVLP